MILLCPKDLVLLPSVCLTLAIRSLAQTTIKARIRTPRNDVWHEASPRARRAEGAGHRMGSWCLAKHKQSRATTCKGAGPLLQ